MTRNTLGDLNNHLFEQLERLNDGEIAGEKLLEEIERSKAINSVSKQIIANANVVLRSQQFYTEFASKDLNKPKMLEG